MGVFPIIVTSYHFNSCLPHARGGVSLPSLYSGGKFQSSPRPWGCFLFLWRFLCLKEVFPTPVGVFLRYVLLFQFGSESSPRPWGCFCKVLWSHSNKEVFPTPVGVFLTIFDIAADGASLPHARGGVSAQKQQFSEQQGSSPRPWGCFYEKRTINNSVSVFPTPVGVFPLVLLTVLRLLSLPHARGGVSGSSRFWAGSRQSSPRPWGCF